jgi:hypothetical protein
MKRKMSNICFSRTTATNTVITELKTSIPPMSKVAIGYDPKPLLHTWNNTCGVSLNRYWLAHMHTKCPVAYYFYAIPTPAFLHIPK